MLRLGCCAQNFRGLSLDDGLRLTAGLGFTDVNIGAFNESFPVPPSTILAAPEKVGRTIREACARFAVTPIEFFICSVVIGDGTRVQPNDPDPLRREAMLEAFRRVCACAAEAGLSHIMGVPGEVDSNPAPGNGREIAIASLLAMREIADAFGVGLTIEPHTRSILTTPDATLAMIAELPGIKLSLDYSHFIGAGFAPESLLPLHAHAAHIHAKPARPGVPKCLFHEGMDYYRPLLGDLIARGWDGIIAMECMYPVPAPRLLEHPAFQSVTLAAHLACILEALSTKRV